MIAFPMQCKQPVPLFYQRCCPEKSAVADGRFSVLSYFEDSGIRITTHNAIITSFLNGIYDRFTGMLGINNMSESVPCMFRRQSRRQSILFS